MPRQRLTKRTDGNYKCKYRDKQFYGKTQAEALRKRDAYIIMEMSGFDHQLGLSTFDEYAEQWIAIYRAECNKAQHKQYLGFAKYAASMLGDTPIKDISSKQLQMLCNTLTCYSGSYIRKFMSLLKGIFSTAAADGEIAHNPMIAVRMPKGKKCAGHRALEEWERELVRSTWKDHDFGPAAMLMMYAGLRRGEVLFFDVDRDVDFKAKTITIRGAVAFPTGTVGVPTPGKTAAAQRVIPLVKPLELALEGKHGLLLTKADGGMMTEIAFQRKYESYITHLETTANGCHKRWYGKTREHKKLLAEGKPLPPWKDVRIRCHDFRVDFCTRNYEAGIPIKTLQKWMGHEDATMILSVYAKLTEEQERIDTMKLMNFMNEDISAS